MKLKRKRIFTLLFALFCAALLHAWGPLENKIKFQRISVEEGLPSTISYCSLQDSHGFIWFGTVGGLARYDGYEFKTFAPIPGDKTSLSHRYVKNLYEDPEGTLWVGTEKGLNKYSREKECFVPFKWDAPDGVNLEKANISDICGTPEGDLWIPSFPNGLFHFDPHTGFVTVYRHDPKNPDSLSSNQTTYAYLDKKGILWVGTRDGGLNRLDLKTGKFKAYRHQPGRPDSLVSDKITTIYEDRQGTFWVGTINGLCKFNRETETFLHYQHHPDNPAGLSHNFVNRLHESNSNQLWVATIGGGVNIMDRSKGTFIHFINEPDNPHSISSNIILSMMEDRSGIMWFTTFEGGISKYDPNRVKFAHYKQRPNDPNSINDNNVRALLKAPDGILWVGTDYGGLNRIDRANHRVKHYKHIPGNPQTLSSNFTWALCLDSSGTLWVGTHENGLNRFDAKTETFRTYRHASNIHVPGGDDSIYSIVEDRPGVLWVGTAQLGLETFHVDTGTFRPYPPPAEPNHNNDAQKGIQERIQEKKQERKQERKQEGSEKKRQPTNRLSGQMVLVMHKDRAGKLWIGTRNGGLNRLDPQTGRFTHYRHSPDKPGCISDNYIVCICEESPDTMWVGTGWGLNRLDTATGTFRHYTVRDGLPSNIITGILHDPHSGTLWISSQNGLFRFDPRTGECKNFDLNSGMQGYSFYSMTAYDQAEDGEMFFGGNNGFNAFYPEKISFNPNIPRLVFTGFELNYKAAAVGGDSPLTKSISLSQRIRLPHDGNTFSVSFAALEFSNPAKNRYRYRMQGLHPGWIDLGCRNKVAFSGLPPGTYVLQVKGANNDGVWNPEPISLKLEIMPPFWTAWWFRMPLLFLLVYMLWKWYVKRLGTVHLKAELQSAREAQMGIMPKCDPQVTGFDISGLCLPAREVGGDFFDYIWLRARPRRFCIAVGDVSGKAMSAAMTAVMSSGVINAMVREFDSPAQVMTEVNASLFAKTDHTMFTALCLVSLDTHSHRMEIVNAGMNKPILRTLDRVDLIDTPGSRLPLGVRLTTCYQEGTRQLEEGDVLILYSDGIPEAMNPHGEFYGMKRLETLIASLDVEHLSAGEMKMRIVEDVQRFERNLPQHDDMVLVVIKVI